MLKVVVFDSGYGGELFADLLEREMPVLEVIRVIAWRDARALSQHARSARRVAEAVLEPYLGQVDLIIFANHLLSFTSLRYFRRRYPDQKFLGLSLEVIRVIAWRDARALSQHARSARRVAEAVLEPYLGQVDLIIFANHLLSFTSLRYFRRRYPDQKFLGLSLEPPATTVKRDYLILTTKAVTKTFHYCHYVFHLPAAAKTLKLDNWLDLIDDGELDASEIATTLENKAIFRNQPRDIVLACASFTDIKPELSRYFNRRVKIYDSFDRALKSTCQILNIRGATGVGRKR